MKESEITLRKGFVNGLRSEERNPRNTELLTVSSGMFPEGGVLRSVDELDNLAGITTLQEAFPYPQVHIGMVHTVIFGSQKIWEMVGSNYNLKLQGLTAGTIWTVADFGDYIVATNGAQMVRRLATSGAWEVFDEDDIPLSSCVAAVNGQLIAGSPRRRM